MTDEIEAKRVDDFVGCLAQRLGCAVDDTESLGEVLRELVYDLKEHELQQLARTDLLLTSQQVPEGAMATEHNDENLSAIWQSIVTQEAADINAGGVTAQARYLLAAEPEQSSAAEILDALGISGDNYEVG